MSHWRYTSEHDWRRHVDWKLDRILEGLVVVVADQAQLDQAIADLATHADAIDAAVDALIAKIESTPNAPDFSSEVAALQAATGNLQTSTDAANAALTAVPVASPISPAEGPAVVVAVTDGLATGPNPPDSVEQAGLDAANATADAQAQANADKVQSEQDAAATEATAAESAAAASADQGDGDPAPDAPVPAQGDSPALGTFGNPSSP